MLAANPVLSVQLVNDTGSSASDRITSEPDIVGSATDDGSIATLTVSFADAPGGTAPVSLIDLGILGSNGAFSLDLPNLQLIRLIQTGSGLLFDQAYTLNFRAVDNESRVTTLAFGFTLDTTPPLAPSFALTTAFDPNQDGVTNFEFVTLAGTTAPGTSVTLDRGNLTTTADAQGKFSFSNVQLFPGPNSLGTVATDLAGNVSVSSRTVTFDQGTPTPNAAPSFTKGADIALASTTAPQTIANWATNISPGPGEAAQTVAFLTSVDRPALFSAAPAISPTGTLTFTLAAGQSGTAVVTVNLKDNGGTANGGVDTSAPQTFQITVRAPLNSRKDTAGFYDPASSTFFLKFENSQGVSDKTFSFGPPGGGWKPLAGDWNGDGTDTVGFYNPATSTFFLKNQNAQGVSDATFSFGPSNSNWVPLSGDWNGDGIDTVGFYEPGTSTFFLKNQNAQGLSDLVFSFGPGGGGWKPLVGDWNGDGTDSIGFYNPATSTFFLKNQNAQGVSDKTFSFGPSNSNWVPLAGDWNSDGTDSVGFYSPAGSTFFLKNDNAQGTSDFTFSFGLSNSNWVPLVGDWDGASVAAMVGDADGDRTVGLSDYALWAAQFGQSGSNLAADFDHDGTVGLSDYALWAANFGRTQGGGGSDRSVAFSSPAPRAASIATSASARSTSSTAARTAALANITNAASQASNDLAALVARVRQNGRASI